MSLYDYKQSQKIGQEGYYFYALIMAAMRKADAENADALRRAFPKVHEEFWKRYHAPGGVVEKYDFYRLEDLVATDDR